MPTDGHRVRPDATYVEGLPPRTMCGVHNEALITPADKLTITGRAVPRMSFCLSCTEEAGLEPKRWPDVDDAPMFRDDGTCPTHPSYLLCPFCDVELPVDGDDDG